MRFPWTRRVDEAKRQTEQAKTDYERAVQNRTTVSTMVSRLIYHGEHNGIVEMIHKVANGNGGAA